jgi:hypothetical protein
MAWTIDADFHGLSQVFAILFNNKLGAGEA